MTTSKLYRYEGSPWGELLLVSDGTALTGLFTHESASQAGVFVAADEVAVFEETCAQLDDYFAGTLTEFDVPLAPRGTPFQQMVWSELCQIPFGETTSYSEIARRVGNPAAMRAVGNANSRNPISIIVPCHRVIGRSGALVGYAGGLDRKSWLLEHEQRVVTGVSAMDPAKAAHRPGAATLLTV